MRCSPPAGCCSTAAPRASDASASRRAARRRGLASAVLAEAEREARAAGAGRMVLHAQTSALVLYEQAGYLPRGERFMEEGIEHLMMVKPLTEPRHA